MAAEHESDDMVRELDQILDNYAKNWKHEKKTSSEEQEGEFLAKFERIKVDIIKPMMDMIGKQLEKKGHAYQIKDEASIYADNPSIRMEIYPKSSFDSPIEEHEFPTITFIAEPDVSEIGIEVKDGMPGRPGLTRGHVTQLESLTEEYVRKQIIFIIKRNFTRVPS